MVALTVFVFAASTILSARSAAMASKTETSFADSTLLEHGATQPNRLRLTPGDDIAEERFFLDLKVVENFRRFLQDTHSPFSTTPISERHTLPAFDPLLHPFTQPSLEAIDHHISQIVTHASDISDHIGNYERLLEKKIHPIVYTDAYYLMKFPFPTKRDEKIYHNRYIEYLEFFEEKYGNKSP